MNQLVILEVGNLGGIVVMIVGIMIVVSLVLSFAAAGIFKLIYEANGNRKLSKGQFWLVVVAGLAICGLISGVICGN